MPLDIQTSKDLANADLNVNTLRPLGAGPGTTAPTLTNQIGQIINVTAARTLLATESGAKVIWSTATGATVTLPAPVVGLEFEFICGITNTATACKVITDAGTTFIQGEVLTIVDNTTPAAGPGPKGFSFNGSSHIAVLFGGADTTAGGVAGTRFKLTCMTSTKWHISGIIVGAGTIVTCASTT